MKAELDMIYKSKPGKKYTWLQGNRKIGYRVVGIGKTPEEISKLQPVDGLKIVFLSWTEED